MAASVVRGAERAGHPADLVSLGIHAVLVGIIVARLRRRPIGAFTIKRSARSR
jgi:hypothetical protein